MYLTKQSVCLMVSIILCLPVPAGAEKNMDDISIVVKAEEYSIRHNSDGQHIHMDGYDSLKTPGKPMLPARQYNILLPPGAMVDSISVLPLETEEMPDRVNIVPVPPIIPLDRTCSADYLLKTAQMIWQETVNSTYGNDTPYPECCALLTGKGSLRKYRNASVLFCPFRYYPQTKRLELIRSAKITVHYLTPSHDSEAWKHTRTLNGDALADRQAKELFVNYDIMKSMYQRAGFRNRTDDRIVDYLIITSRELSDTIAESDFIPWKQSLGYNVEIFHMEDPEIQSRPGRDLAEQIRNFLKLYYGSWNIQFVLLVGDYVTVPMRYCYPNPNNHVNTAGDPGGNGGDVPTDYYYADLSDPDTDSWDKDDDGFYGEYGEDEPDFLPEVYVGRIPTDDPARITYTLNKLTAYEQDTGAWKNSALHGGAFWYLTNEDRNGRAAYDGACCLNEIEIHLLDGWTVTHFSEQEGLEKSIYPWPPLTETAFAGAWKSGSYGLVNWGAHGWSDGAARKFWDWDDGDNVPESNVSGEIVWPRFIRNASQLDDDYLCIFFAISCVIGYPEPNHWGNFGIDLLTKPSWGAGAGVVGASRVAYGSSGWPENPGGSESVCYEFNRLLLAGSNGPERVGEALYNAKYYCNAHYAADHFSEYWTMVNFNLFGDPAMVREGTYPEPTPTPAPTCGPLGVSLWMPAQLFEPGDPFACSVFCCNPSHTIYSDVPLFVILDVYGEYFCAPGFTEMDYYTISLEPGLAEMVILSEFPWPDDAGSATGLTWYAGMTNPEFTALFGEFDTWIFSFQN
jgi:Peptidase family C25/Propeptide_C25